MRWGVHTATVRGFDVSRDGRKGYQWFGLFSHVFSKLNVLYTYMFVYIYIYIGIINCYFPHSILLGECFFSNGLWVLVMKVVAGVWFQTFVN